LTGDGGEDGPVVVIHRCDALALVQQVSRRRPRSSPGSKRRRAPARHPSRTRRCAPA
jgi:hypothetical protein